MNQQGLADKYVDYWAKVANTLSSNKYVMGFDPFNEPLPSWTSIKDAINTIYPGHFDHNNLAPLYTKINAKLQAASSANIMWFEPGQFPDTLPFTKEGLVMNVGFDVPPGGQIGSKNHVLNDHTYCCQLSPSICATGEPLPSDKERCGLWHQNKVGTRAKNAKRLGIPLFISEFGACMNSEACATEITQVADVVDSTLAAGWSYWQFKNYKDLTTSAGSASEGFYNNDGTLETIKVKALSRTYVKAAQGTIKSMKFFSSDSQTQGKYKEGTFFADIEVDMKVKAPTLIHALGGDDNGLTWYPQDFEITVTSNDKDLPQV